MGKLDNLDIGNNILYSDGYFSGDYNQVLYLTKSVPDCSNRSRFYLRILTNINGNLVQQGFLYFYLDQENRTSDFIGLHVNPEYRNLNIGSFLVASWIDLCQNNNYDFLGANEKQRKPFLLYLLKTYGFEILDKSLYDTRQDVISICRKTNTFDNNKFLLFKDPKIEETFMDTHIYKTDNYEIIHNEDEFVVLDNIILPLRCIKRDRVKYNLLDHGLAKTKTKTTISRHKR